MVAVDKRCCAVFLAGLSFATFLIFLSWTRFYTNTHPFSTSLSQLSKLHRTTNINPLPVKENSNVTASSRLERYRRKIFTSTVDLERENFTMVMLTYRREVILPKLLLHYCKTPRLARMVIIWNDVERDIPKDILNLTHSCAVSLLFIRETTNKITNRFKPRPEIQTDCVFILDDDRWINDLSDISFAFSVWQENRHRIVGFNNCQRSHSLHSDGNYTYDQATPGKGVSIMMTATGLLHRAYLEMYFDSGAVLPAGMLEEDDWTMYCDDLLMNCLVGRFLEEEVWPQPSLIVVRSKGGMSNLEREAARAGGHPGLHRMRPDHYERRSTCLNKIATIYGHLPLHLTKVIVMETVKSKH